MFRNYLNTFLQVTAVSLVAIVLYKVGFQRVWDAGSTIFSSWGGVFTFLGAMLGISALLTFWGKH